MKTILKRYAAFLFALVFLAGLAYSQSGTTGAIEGKITDEEGNALPGATVKVSSPDLIGGAQTKITNAEGKFRFVALPRGTYVLEASMKAGVPGWIHPHTDWLASFPPFNNQPTQYRMTVDGEQKWFAQ